jgi:dihydropyrimidinase
VTEFDKIIRNGLVVTIDGERRCDIGIRDGRIVALEESLSGATEEIDACGLIVLPGGVDSHVHVDQPFSSGAKIADDFSSGTGSALAGGTTTIISFAVQPRGGSLTKAVEDYAELAKRSRCDYSFHLLVTDPRPDILADELPGLVAAGHRSIKIFMTNDSTRLVDRQIIETLAAARALGALVCVHAEHNELIGYLTERLLAQGITEPYALALAKPMIVEREATHRIIALAEALNTPLQIFHVSGAESAEEVARARARGVQVWAETCTQYLVLTADDLKQPGMEGAKLMFAPAPRTKADQDALWNAITDRTIEIITSDHSPLRFEGPDGKLFAGDNAPFDKIPNGVPGLAARLPLVYSEGVAKGRIDLKRFVDLVATMPAKLFGLYPQKGVIAIGSDADLTLFDPNAEQILSNAMMHHGSDYTPFEGMAVTGAVHSVLLRGETAFAGETVVSSPGQGRHLPRAPYDFIAPNGHFPIGFDPHAQAKAISR